MKVSLKEGDQITIKRASDVYQIMRLVLKRTDKIDQNKEHLWVMAFNDINKIVSLELVALGSSNEVSASPADVLAIPLQKQAKGIMLIHNHPSGILEPSEKDKDLTDHLIQACKLMNTPVLDHIIITEHSYFSFAESGLLERLARSTKYALQL